MRYAEFNKKTVKEDYKSDFDQMINKMIADIWGEEEQRRVAKQPRYLVYSQNSGLEMDTNSLEDAVFAAQAITKRNLDSPSLVYDRVTKYPVVAYRGSEDLWYQKNRLHEAGTRVGALNTVKQLYIAIAQNQGSESEIDLLQRQMNALMRKYNITFKDIGVKTPPMPAGQYVKWMPPPIEEGNPVDVWAIMGRGQMGSRGYIPPNLKTSEIPIDQIGSGGQTRLFVKRKVFRDIFSGYARTQALKADPNYGKDMRAMDFKKINQNVIDMAKQAGLEYDGTKWYYDIYSPITPNLKKHLIYLQDQFGDSVSADNKYKDAGIKKKSEKEEVKEYGEIDTKRKIEFSKENPPNIDELYRQFIQTMLAPGNNIEPQDWINNVNNTYGTRYTYKDYQSRGHKDYTNSWDKIVQKYILGKK
jgi:hypothetical protein